VKDSNITNFVPKTYVIYIQGYDIVWAISWEMEVKIYSFYDNNTGSANSKYAFLGSKWPVVELFLPMLQTISEKFINNLLGTLCVSCILCASKVKILSNMNNPQVTKAFNSWVGTSEAIRLLSIDTKLRGRPPVNKGSHLNSKREKNLHFVTGFVDAEGSFHISITKTDSNFGWKVTPQFSIKLHIRDFALLYNIQKIFGSGVGKITKGNGYAVFSVFSLKELTNIIIPHFINYPLITKKQADFLLFKSVIELMNKAEHLTKEGFNQILSLKASMNLGLPGSLKAAFPSVSPVIRPEIKVPENINPYWMAYPGMACDEYFYPF